MLSKAARTHDNAGGRWCPKYHQSSNHDDTPAVVTDAVIGDTTTELVTIRGRLPRIGLLASVCEGAEMGARGQNPESWLSRWRKGDCPIHGTGLVAEAGAGSNSPVAGAIANDESGSSDERGSDESGSDESGSDGDGIAVRCPREGCTVRACQWPGHDDAHSFFGWLEGPDEIRAVLARAGDVAAEGPRPSHHARSVRTAWPLPENA